MSQLESQVNEIVIICDIFSCFLVFNILSLLDRDQKTDKRSAELVTQVVVEFLDPN